MGMLKRLLSFSSNSTNQSNKLKFVSVECNRFPLITAVENRVYRSYLHLIFNKGKIQAGSKRTGKKSLSSEPASKPALYSYLKQLKTGKEISDFKGSSFLSIRAMGCIFTDG